MALLLTRMKEIVELRCFNLVKEVRGLGLLIGVELHTPGLAGALLGELLARHLIVNHSHNADSVLRFTPPAVMTEGDINFLLSAFDGACTELAALHPTVESVGAV